jgi:hypothetical protein
MLELKDMLFLPANIRKGNKVQTVYPNRLNMKSDLFRLEAFLFRGEYVSYLMILFKGNNSSNLLEFNAEYL